MFPHMVKFKESPVTPTFLPFLFFYLTGFNHRKIKFKRGPFILSKLDKLMNINASRLVSEDPTKIP